VTNVVLVVIDALRADRLGAYAGRDTGTPNLDALAGRGVVFENAISQASWTRPSVGSIMTGLYPSQHGLADRWRTVDGRLTVAALDTSIPTLAERLPDRPTVAFVGCNANLKPMFGMTRGFDLFRWHPDNDGTVLVEDLEAWLREEPPDGAFCYMHFMDVHNPLPAEILPSRLAGGTDLDAGRRSIEELAEHYDAAVRRADAHVGRVISALEEATAMEDAWVIVTADHGEELMDHGKMLSHGRTLYRELVRVPLIVKPPEGTFEPGARVAGPVELIDLAPTVLDHFAVPAPELPGRDLLPRIRGEEPGETPAGFSELLRRDRYGQSITTKGYRFVQTYLFEEAAEVSPADLREGDDVVIKGQAVGDGTLLATRIALKPGVTPKVRGNIERSEDGELWVMGISFRFGGETGVIDQHREPVEAGDLAVGEKVAVSFVERDGERVATSVQRRNLGGKNKIWGPIERVREMEPGLISLTVLGVEITVDVSMAVSPPREKKGREQRPDALARVLTGEFVDSRRELYDTAADPAETTNVVDERPDIAAGLEERLMLWTDWLASGGDPASGSVDVDPETMEQLRRMGYVE